MIFVTRGKVILEVVTRMINSRRNCGYCVIKSHPRISVPNGARFRIARVRSEAAESARKKKKKGERWRNVRNLAFT